MYIQEKLADRLERAQQCKKEVALRRHLMNNVSEKLEKRRRNINNDFAHTSNQSSKRDILRKSKKG